MAIESTTRFTLRPATLDDMSGALALANAYSQETIGRDEFDIEDYRRIWNDPAHDLATDTRIAQTADGTIVGSVELWNNAPYVGCWIWGCVHPAFRDQGIGTALIEWAEQRAQVALARAPAGVRVILETSVSSGHHPSIDLLNERGFRAVRDRASMLRELDADLPAPIWPAGITVSPMQPGQELALYRAKEEAFRDHWGHLETPEQEGFTRWEQRRINDSNYDPALWFVATERDAITGFALCQRRTSEDPAMGWVNSLGVRRPWRRRGLAEALLYHSFRELRRRGCARVGLDVDVGSLTGAERLYAKAGMHEFGRTTRFQKELRPGIDPATQAISSG